MRKNKVRKNRRNIQQLYWIGLFGFAVTALFITLFSWMELVQQESSFEPEQILEVSHSEGLLGVSYNYYLDFSPSMGGFFTEELNSTMFSLGNTLQELNSNYQSVNFYRCTSVIEPLGDAEYFYNSMKSGTNLQSVYDVEVDAQTIGDTIRQLDLSKIWSDRYTDGSFFHGGEKNVNIIITDMNFRKNEWDEEGYSLLIQQFARYLGEAAKNANISIYNLYSEFRGSLADDYYISPNVETGEAGSEEESTDSGTQGYSGTRPFFMIVLSVDNDAYSAYKQVLEEILDAHQIDYTENFELLNSMEYVAAHRKADLGYYIRNNWVQIKSGFNFDNESFEQLKDNEMALQIITGPEASEITMNMFQLDIPGYYYIEDESDLSKRVDNTIIDVVSKVYYPHKNWPSFLKIGYTEDTGSNIVMYQSAEMLWQRNQLYLRASLRLDNTTEMPRAEKRLLRLGLRPHFVVYLQFYLNTPDYVVPEWVQEINCTEITSEARMLNVESVFATIVDKKKIAYATRDISERYLGDAVIYITYVEE